MDLRKRRTFSGGPDDPAFYLSVDEPGGHYEGAGLGGEYRVVSDFPGSFLQKKSGRKASFLPGMGLSGGCNLEGVLRGDLAGIRSRLAYIADLGVGGIYLNPILWSDSNHRYDTIDYHSVEPDLGTEEELKALIAEAHALGLRVMIDAVFNHCGAKCALWQDVLEKGPQSSYYHWFCVNRWPIDAQTHATKRGDYFSFAFVDNMPKFDTSEPDVMEYLTGIAEALGM